MTWEKHKITQNSGLLRNGLSKSDRDRTDRNKRKRSKPDNFNRDLLFQLLYLRDHLRRKEENLKKLLWETFSVDDLTIGDKEKDDIIRNL